MANSTYKMKHEIWAILDELRETKIAQVDPTILAHIIDYVDNNAETIASLYANAQEDETDCDESMYENTHDQS